MKASIELRYSPQLAGEISRIYSDRVLSQIAGIFRDLPDFPEMGSANIRQSLIDWFGPGIRKVAVSTFVLIYRYDEDARVIDILTLMYGPRIK